MSQALSLFDLLVNVGQRVLQVCIVGVLLLVEWSHTKLLMGQSLVLAPRWSLLFGAWSHRWLLLPGLNGYETVAFLNDIHLLASSTESSDGLAKEL